MKLIINQDKVKFLTKFIPQLLHAHAH